MYDEALADRIRAELSPLTPFTERKMFGGLAFLINGHMACGIVRDELMVRTGPDGYETALAKPDTRPMDFTDRPMGGMVMVGRAGFAEIRFVPGSNRRPGSQAACRRRCPGSPAGAGPASESFARPVENASHTS